jgi:hypothetical protein
MAGVAASLHVKLISAARDRFWLRIFLSVGVLVVSFFCGFSYLSSLLFVLLVPVLFDCRVISPIAVPAERILRIDGFRFHDVGSRFGAIPMLRTGPVTDCV